mgnify:CR=1 FL=1
MMLTVFSASAQMEMMTQPLPIDPNVRVGRLDNGLTYYIRHNEWPEQRANFYIAQKVGSMQEEENQRGLAHFLEHMCFNGTTHFPGNKLKTYLETIGVKFGENLNAYTSFDETVYNIDNVKTTSEGSLDSCLLILHDWSHDLLLEGEEIDKERGVINEEWRMRRSAMQRMYEGALPDIYPGSKYAHRMPIGTMDIVMNFPHDDLRAYYKKWYRPDLQGIIVVGDVDVDKMEAKIKSAFADIQAPAADAAVREYFPVPDTAEPLVSIQTDKEQTNNIILLMMKHDTMSREEKGSLLKLISDYADNAISSMFSDRIREILQQPNAPFMQAAMEDGEFFVAKTKDAVTGQVVFKDNAQDEALAALYREMLRAARFGFTESEYDRFKEEYLSRLEDRYAKKDKVQSVRYVNQCVRHFLDGDAMPGIDTEYQVMKMLVPQLPVGLINEALKESVSENDSNLVLVMFAPEKENIQLPSKEHLVDVLHKVRQEEITAYVEEVNNDPLITEELKGSKVKSIKDGEFDSKIVTLDNGIVIHVKKTDYTPNSITMRATSWGGTAYYNNDEYLNAGSIDELDLGGYGNFSATNLKKRLAGIQANVSPNISHRTEGVSGSCVVKDFETMMQLTYLTFTSLRRDNDAFQSYQERTRQALHNQELNPTVALQDTIVSVLYKNNVRQKRIKEADVDKLDYDRMIQIYNERFADGDDFEFFFVGDIDLDTALPLFEKYLGSLPVQKGEEKQKGIDLRLTKGKVTNVFEKEQQTPNAIVLFVYHAPLKDTPRNGMVVDMIQQLLSMHYTESVREDEGGAYGVPVQAGVQDYPEEIGQVIVQLPTAPEKRARMTELVYEGIEKFCDEGPNAENLLKVREYMHRKHAEDLKQNSYWMNALVQKYRYNQDAVSNYDQIVDEISAKEIQDVAKTILRSGNVIEVGMTSPVTK